MGICGGTCYTSHFSKFHRSYHSISPYSDRPSWFKILTHRNRTLEIGPSAFREFSLQEALDSANKMTEIVERVLASGRVMHCPIHIVPSLFAAMTIHAKSIRSNQSIHQELAFLRVRICMIALRKVKTSWPVGGWILLLFTKFIRNMQGTNDIFSMDFDTISREPKFDTPPLRYQHRDRPERPDQAARIVHSPMQHATQSLANNNVCCQIGHLNERSTTLAPLDSWLGWGGASFDDLCALPNFALGGDDLINDPSMFSMSSAFL